MGKKSREKLVRRDNDGSVSKAAPHVSQVGLEKALVFIIQWATYLIMFTPLIVDTDFFFPFVAPKTIFFRIMIEIMLAAYLLLLLINRKYRPRLNHLTVALLLFLLVFIIASFTGVNFSRSFWSTYERMTGIFTMLHLGAFFVILTSVFKKRTDWEKFLGVSIIVGVLLGLYVLTSNQISTRGGGTIGNTSFLAAYILFDIFFAIILFLARRGIWQIFAGVSLLIMLPVLFTSTARGAVGAFIIALFLMALGYFIFSGNKLMKRFSIAVILLFIIIALFFAVVQPPIAKSVVSTLLSEMQSRFAVWGSGWSGFLERPILGWGPENFNVVFLKYFNPCMGMAECGSEVWFDRTHNIILDTLITTGIVGLLSYLAIFAVVIYGLIMVMAHTRDKRDLFISLGLIVLLIAYFVQNMLVFDMINSYLVFFLALAFASFMISSRATQEEPEEPADSSHSLNVFMASAIIGFTIFLIWPANISTLIANRYIIKMVQSDNIPESIDFFEKSLDTWMEKYEAREHFAQKLIRSSYQLTDASAEDKEVFNKIFVIGEREMEKSVRENSLDFRHHLFAGEVYTGSYRMSGDMAKIVRAEQILKKAVELSPTNQQGYWQLAEINVVLRKVDEAVPYVQKALELEPRVGRSHWYLAMTYQLKGDYQMALQEAERAIDNGHNWIDNAQDFNKVVRILLKLRIDPATYFAQRSERMLQYFEELVQAEQDLMPAWMSLATYYANAGRYDDAKRAAQKVAEIDPSMAGRVNDFLASLLVE